MKPLLLVKKAMPLRRCKRQVDIFTVVISTAVDNMNNNLIFLRTLSK